jgi:hypothetical protein
MCQYLYNIAAVLRDFLLCLISLEKREKPKCEADLNRVEDGHMKSSGLRNSVASLHIRRLIPFSK